MLIATGTSFSTVGELIFAGAAVLVTAVFGWPAWKLSRRAEHQAAKDDAQARTEALAVAVAGYLGVPLDKTAGSPGRIVFGREQPSKENPSVLDLLTEIRDYQQEQAILSLIIAHHLGDNHGPAVPEWVFEKANQRRE